MKFVLVVLNYTGRICVIGKDLLEDKIYELFGVE